MPVPASYNDITENIETRDHIGYVWYETNFFISKNWKNNRIFLRVGSATHSSIVWLNGKEITKHTGGFLPFEVEITDDVNFGQNHRLTIAVDNRLTWNNLPPGEIKSYNDENHPDGFKIQEYYFDFFNYSGLHRPVRLIAVPKTFIQDITAKTTIKKGFGIITYKILTNERKPLNSQVRLLDKFGKEVLKTTGLLGDIKVQKPNLWEWGNPYLYTLETKIFDDDNNLIDCYRLPIGIRTIKVTQNKFLLNGKPFYFKGFGKHEDSDIRGKGLDNAINVKDFNLLKWMGANSFRTSHYPYSEEIMNLADEEGFLIIDEVPAVGMNLWDHKKSVFNSNRVNQKTLNHHLQTIRELIQRDKNHPSVVMWSVANEATTYEKKALPYFKKVVEEVRKLDPTRPVTIVNSSSPDKCKVSHLFDVICINRYFGWYTDTGHLELIEHQIGLELDKWFKNFKKPILVTEYGADTIAGIHKNPPSVFSEEFQIEFLNAYNRVFDKKKFVIGEHIWCFADFVTKQGINRVMGNKKGVFTRQRDPKSAAFIIRKRWNEEKV